MFSEWINEAKREIENDKTGEKKYLHMCEETGVIPASYFLNHIQEKEFSMKYHGLGPNGAKAIAWPLKVYYWMHVIIRSPEIIILWYAFKRAIWKSI